jgi:hypothetical protein
VFARFANSQRCIREVCTKPTGWFIFGCNRFAATTVPQYALTSMLSALFVMSMGIGQFNRSFALWHETRNDYGKRRLLRTAIANLPASEIGERTELVAEITWILDAADKLEGLRDDSVHTPVHYTFPISFL